MMYLKKVPVIAQADVVVVGGGLGGCASALASARAGAKTVLIERNGFLGGVATAGLCCSLFNCTSTKDGDFTVSGPVMDIVNALARNAGGPGDSWRNHLGHMVYDVEKAKLVLLDLLKQNGVDVRLFTTVCDVKKCGKKKVTGVYVVGRNGLELIEAKAFVDASGDSDLAVAAGCNYKMNTGAKASYLFRLGNVDLDAFVDFFRQNPEEYKDYLDLNWTVEDAIKQYDENGTFLFPHGGGLFLKAFKDAIANGEFKETLGTETELNACQMHCIRGTGTVHVITGFTQLPNLGTDVLTDRVYEGKQMVYYVAEFMKRHLPGFENAYVATTADDLGIRLSRLLEPRQVIDTSKPDLGASQAQNIVGRAVIIEHGKADPKYHWSYQVMGDRPFDILLDNILPKTGPKNIIVGAGRCITAKLRVMVDTMVVGQGAGVAAAVAARQGKDFDTFDKFDLQVELKRQDIL